MNLVEKSVERLEKRIKRVKENPDPQKLHSNLLGFELDLEAERAVLEAWRQGKPIIPDLPTSLALALGAQPVNLENGMDPFPEEAPRYFQAVRDMGLPEYMCDGHFLCAVGTVLGEFPPPSLVPLMTGCCRVLTYCLKVLAEYFDVPKFELDGPQEYNLKNALYMADQLGELIEFAEKKVPGIKYNKDKHMELLEGRHACGQYLAKEWELRRRVPFPLDTGDSFRQPFRRSPDGFLEPAKVLEYWRIRTEEVEERAAKGVEREEKLRFLWIWGRPVYMNPVPILEARGVSVPAVYLPATSFFSGKFFMSGDNKEFEGRELSPLEEDASMLVGGIGEVIMDRGRWAEDIVWTCQDLKCDAIVYYQQVGCLHMAPLARVVADRAEKELGVPTLILSGRKLQSTFLPPAEFEARLTEFIDMVLDRKGQK